MSDDNKVVPFGSVQGGKSTEEDTLPANEYLIVDINGEEFYNIGFLLFTTQHVAVMEDRGKHTVPVFLMPLDRLAFVQLVSDDED